MYKFIQPFRGIKKFFPLVAILAAGLGLRLYGINWDLGAHLHPDERMLIMVAERLLVPGNSNPDFFNYGSLPIYLLSFLWKVCNFTSLSCAHLSSYDGLLVIGRSLSVLTDMGTLCVIYAIARLCWPTQRNLSLFPVVMYAFAFFPIQNTHFFVVDVFMTFFVTLGMYFIFQFLRQDRYSYVVYAGMSFGAAFASKFTALVFFAGVVATLLIWLMYHKEGVLRIIRILLMLGMIFLCTHIVCMPYAYRIGAVLPHTIPFDSKPASLEMIEDRLRLIRNPESAASVLVPPRFITKIASELFSKRYILDTLEQAQMNKNAYVFPYTLQYVGTTPYLYYISQIYLWGLGPCIFIFACIGFAIVAKQKWSTHFHMQKNLTGTYLLIFFTVVNLFYFLVVGMSAVKFMRYMLPLYPLFALYAGYGLFRLLNSTSRWSRIIATVIFVLACLWTVGFVNIYSQYHTRQRAHDWALANIPSGSTIAVEHWDDRPIDGGAFKFVEMTNFELPDDLTKWQALETKLGEAQYIVLASNRLYTPMQKLHDCEKYYHCYPTMNRYYQDLFAERNLLGSKLRFVKVKEFTSYPTIQVGPFHITIPDDSADESFTVYDHPKVMIFKKI
ncbi:MAG: glycosyltransferase family 39 protein [bacterium]